jgi:hypothetical protein
MSEVRDDANEADQIEQRIPVAGEDDETTAAVTPLEADEADVAEQHLVVPTDDEDAYDS